MFIEILTPEDTVYVGNVKGIQLPGINGSFELLENHAAMVAALGKGKMKILLNDAQNQVFEIDGGFVQTSNNKTAVLLESVKK